MKDEYFTLNGSLYFQEESTGLVWYVGADNMKVPNHEDNILSKTNKTTRQ